jgi:hypothetical protein
MRFSLASGLSVSLVLAACAHEGQTPSAYDPGARESLRIPGGKRCLSVLDQLHVKYERLRSRGRVVTPVSIESDLGGVRFTQSGKTSLVCDCRLALALYWSAPVFKGLHISEVEHFGAYSNRTTRGGRPSLHALGLAVDTWRFKFDAATASVVRDYAHGWGDGCSPNAPVLNRLACGLRGLGLFRELITPDHDSDHHDHIHLGIVPL